MEHDPRLAAQLEVDGEGPGFALPAQFIDWFASRGWQPRAHQLELLAKVRSGKSVLLIAPTGAGKTLAGFLPSLTDLAGAPEDDVEQARKDAAIVEPGDCVICVSASGSTPSALAIAEEARRRGAKVVALANNPGARLFAHADVSILLQTPPEVIAGSTRMGAGTAQKIAFNMLSTLAGVKLGHVHDGHMVNLYPDNEKLRARAARMVSEIAGIEDAAATRLLETAAGSVKVAVLLASGAPDADAARAALARSGDALRPAIAEFNEQHGFHKRA